MFVSGGKPLFIRSFSLACSGYRIAGDATAAGAQANAKSPKERYENLFLSISTMPFSHYCS
jgi:hypothetical protein